MNAPAHRTPPSPHRGDRRPPHRSGRRHLVGGLSGAAVLALTGLAAAGLVGGPVGAAGAATTAYTFDTGAGLVVSIDPANGNLTSLKHRGVELGAPGRAAGQFESGWSSATVTRTTFAGGNTVLFAASHAGVTQYYLVRTGDNTIYLATDITAPLGEARFIARLRSSLLPVSPVAARTAGTTSAVEGSDVFRFADGRTASKFYGSQRLIDQKPFGAHGSAHGVYVIPGRQEEASGGPFFRDIEVNDTGDVTNVTAYQFSGHTQTEPLRLGLHGPYALAVTDGPAPAAVNLDFLSAYLPGLPSAAQRGTVSGTATGTWGRLPATVALSGPTGQYWSRVGSGSFTVPQVRPGTYTATLYAGELAVGTPRTVTVTAGGTTRTALTGDVPAPGTLFQLGTFDGTPAGFLNADRIATMHPSDVRMSPWKVDHYTVGASIGRLPMALFKDVNSGLPINFRLASVPAGGVRLRIAVTSSFAGGRPAVAIGGWTSPASASPAPVDLHSRGVTRGTWRGVNRTYTFTVPASALHVGGNTLTVSVLSGSSGTGFLSPNVVLDALALDPA